MFLTAAVVFTVNQVCISLTKRGFATLGGVVQVVQLLAIAYYLIIFWGVNLPMGQLMLVAAVALAGGTLGLRLFSLTAFLAAGSFLMVGILQSKHIILSDQSWRRDELHMEDVIAYVFILSVIYYLVYQFIHQMKQASDYSELTERSLIARTAGLEEEIASRTTLRQVGLAQRLKELHALADYGSRISNILHDLASPLTALGLSVGERHSKAGLKLVELQVKQMRELLRAAESSLPDLGHYHEVDLKDLLLQVSAVVAPIAKRQRVRMNWPRLPHEPCSAPSVLSRLLQNILLNAIGAAGFGKRGQVALTVHLIADQLVFVITDNGRGIPSKIIESAQRRSRLADGMRRGRGLPSSYRLARELGATLHFRQALPQGTTCTISVPVGSHLDQYRDVL
jgi:signal transduction histidine kinase